MALFSPVFQQFFDNNGNPLAGGKLYTYEAGTTTNKVTYTSEDETTANANPIILDAGGRADIWLESGSYKLVLDDSADVLVDQIDNITGAAANVFGSSVVDIAVNTNVTSVYQNNVIRTTATPITLTLLPAATAGEGFLFSVKNTSAGPNTIDPDAAELIDGNSTLTLGAGSSTLIVCDGTGWTSLFIADDILPLDNDFTGDNTFIGKTAYKDAGELTLATGAITITGTAHTIDTEADAASDDLDTITGGADGEILILRIEDAARVITIKDGTGNIQTPNGGDIILDGISKTVALQYDLALTAWVVLSSPASTGVSYLETVVYTSSGSFAKASYPGGSKIKIRLTASGGGGAGSGTAQNNCFGGSGAAGGSSEKWVDFSALSASETVTIGAAGSAGAASGNGGTGGTTIFGAHTTATGGAGGSTSASSGARAIGGVGSSGDININGGSGSSSNGTENNAMSVGVGGGSIWGTGGSNGAFGTSGNAGAAYGSGGGSGSRAGAGAAQTGAAGKTGIIIVDIYG